MNAPHRLDSVPVVQLVRGAERQDYGIDAEQALLGALLLDAGTLGRIGGLRAEHFSGEGHGAIFQAIKDEAEDSGATDLVAVGDRLQRNGRGAEVVAYLATLAQATPGAANIERYAELVIERSRCRRLADLGREIEARAATPGADADELRREMLARIAAIKPERTEDLWPAPLDLAALAGSEPKAPQHIIAAWLPAGEVTLLAGHGGAGKSAIALHLAACIALGARWCGLETMQRRVLYVSAEDPATVLHWRLTRIAAHMGVALQDLAGRLALLDASHLDGELMIEAGRGEEPILTARYEALGELMRDSQVLILDGASDLYGASEIVRRHVRRFIRALRRLVGPEGAVLLLAHLDKAAVRDISTADRYSGSTAWHNSVRSRWALGTDKLEEALTDGAAQLTLSLSKANLARAGAEIRLRWSDEAHMYLPEDAAVNGGIIASIRERTERAGILAAFKACADLGLYVPAATTGRRTAFHVLAAQPTFPSTLLSGKPETRRFWRYIEELRAMRQIREDSIARPGDRGHKVNVLALIDECGESGNAA
jgi:archaellum biogenesis ATPase FlaH